MNFPVRRPVYATRVAGTPLAQVSLAHGSGGGCAAENMRLPDCFTDSINFHAQEKNK
jgi:hypothetical protein